LSTHILETCRGFVMSIKKDTHNSGFEKFREFTKKIVSVPKAEIDRRETEYKKSRAKLKRRAL
jgi:hypothetical protein